MSEPGEPVAPRDGEDSASPDEDVSPVGRAESARRPSRARDWLSRVRDSLAHLRSASASRGPDVGRASDVSLLRHRRRRLAARRRDDARPGPRSCSRGASSRRSPASCSSKSTSRSRSPTTRAAPGACLQDASETIRRPFFFAVSVLAVLFIVSLYSKLVKGQHSLTWGLPFVLGGALGNLSDRVTRNSVIDFIDYRADWVLAMNRGIAAGLKYVGGNWGLTDHWPTFNIADVAICIGRRADGGRHVHLASGSRTARAAPLQPVGASRAAVGIDSAGRRSAAMHGRLFQFDLSFLSDGLVMPFPSYFVLLLAGFLLATVMGAIWAKRVGQNPDVVVDLGLAMVLAGVAGGRLLHVFADGHFMDYVNLCVDPRRSSGRSRQAQCRSADYGGTWDFAKQVCHPTGVRLLGVGALLRGRPHVLRRFRRGLGRCLVSPQGRQVPVLEGRGHGRHGRAARARFRAHRLPARRLLFRNARSTRRLAIHFPAREPGE